MSRSHANMRIYKEVSGRREVKEGQVEEGMDVRTEEIKVKTVKEINERMDNKINAEREEDKPKVGST
jgi:hypothetical protein